MQLFITRPIGIACLLAFPIVVLIYFSTKPENVIISFWKVWNMTFEEWYMLFWRPEQYDYNKRVQIRLENLESN